MRHEEQINKPRVESSLENGIAHSLLPVFLLQFFSYNWLSGASHTEQQIRPHPFHALASSNMVETSVMSGRPADEAQYGAEKEHDSSSSRSTAQGELETGTPQPKDEGTVSPRPVHGIKVCSGLCLLVQETIEAGHSLTWSDSGSSPTYPSLCRSFCFPWTTPL